MGKKRIFDALPDLEKILLENGCKTGRQLVTISGNRYLDNSNVHKVLLTSDCVIRLPKPYQSYTNEYNHIENYTPAELKRMYKSLSDKDKRKVDDDIERIKSDEE